MTAAETTQQLATLKVASCCEEGHKQEGESLPQSMVAAT